MTTPFTDTSTAPRIVEETSYDIEKSWPPFATGAVPIYSRTVITTRLKHTILTQAAADSIALSKSSETDKSAASQRMNQPGWFQVSVTERHDCAWET